MMAAVSMASKPAVEPSDDGYQDFLTSLRDNFNAATAGGVKLFTTTAEGLYDVFLANLPPENRQHYNCRSCRRFVDTYGSLVTVSADGSMVSVMWSAETAPSFFREAARAIARQVARAKVSGVFLSENQTWGLPSNKSVKPPYSWRHMHVVPGRSLIFKPGPILTTSQVVAEKLQDYGMLQRGLAEFQIDVVRQAHTLLTTGALYRSEKCIGAAKWLLDLHEARAATKSGAARDNLTWLAVATAPAGFCHVRTSMIGTLLEDIASGMLFEQVKRRFDEKMDPLQYQRPQAAPSAGNIAQAETIVAKLASAGALTRRFAKLEDIQALWTSKPTKAEPASGGVFGHLKTKETKVAAQIEQPPVTMTWEKFARTVLPEAEAIEFYVPTSPAPYVTLITAADPDAPPILQWDREEKRNPVSWYFYSGGRTALQVNLKAGAFHPVSAVTLQPSMWDADGRFTHQGEKVFFLLQGARDLSYQRGAGFFPETLRSEYHGVRATMEAYAMNAVVQGAEEASATGIGLQKSSGTWNFLFRVTSKAGRVTYKLDRWD